MSHGQYHGSILELVFHSATNLRKLPFSLKAANPYVIADIISLDTKPNWVKTITDEKGGENPVWDYLILFPLNQQTLHMARNFNLIAKIMHSGTALGDREIGHVKVRLPILLAGGENITYPVVSGGVERGKIAISHKLVENVPASPLMMGVEDPNQKLPVELESLNTTSVHHNPMIILELVFHCAIDLPHPLFNSKARPYVLAAIVGGDTKPNWVKTITDEKGGENPVWDYVIQFHLNQEMLQMARNFNLVCMIMHLGSKLGVGDREIGHVKVRLQAFLAGAATGERILYPVVSGRVEKGKIVISHRLVTNTAGTAVDVSAPPSVGTQQDPNHGVVPNTVDGMRLAARATTMAAALYGVVADLA